MNETTLIKVEENRFNESCSDDSDASASSSASGSPQTSLHQCIGIPLKIETTTGRVAKIKHEESREREPLLNHEKTTILEQSLRVQDPSEYRCERCIAQGKEVKLYANKTTLGAHIRNVHSSTPRFKCEVCFKQFNISSNFRRHSRVHLNLNQTVSFKCELCFETLTTKANLNLHLVQNHNHSSEKLNVYQCELCVTDDKKLKYFATKQRLLVHIGNVHRLSPRFKCEVCFKQFNCSSNFKKHSLRHLNQTLYFKCEVCFVTLSTKFSLNVHLVRKHNYNSKELNMKEFPCDLCSSIYFRKSALEGHVVSVHVVDKPLECHVCFKTFIDHEALSNHLKSHNTQPCYNCDVCFKAFKGKRNLLHHLGVEHLRFFRCDKCKNSFSNKSEFDSHSDLQQEIQNACHICNTAFPNQCSLRHHTEFHNSTQVQSKESDILMEDAKIENFRQKFKCELCSKQFNREGFIVAHRKLVHPKSHWPCSKCSRTFKSHSQMKTHELTHEDVRPYTCKLCDKSFNRAHKLKVHENNKHSNRKHYKCKLCPESFATSLTMKSHMANYHGGEKPFKSQMPCLQFFVGD